MSKTGRVLSPSIIFFSGCLVIGAVFFRSIGWPFGGLEHNLPPGQTLYLVSKGVGLIVLWLWLFQLLMQYMPLLHRSLEPRRLALWHRRIGISLFVGAMVHVGCFVTAASLRNEHFAYKLLTFQFDGYYKTRVTLGFIALLFLIAAVLPRLLLKASNATQTLWITWLHRLNFPAFLLVLWHALSIGTESQDPVLLTFFLSGIVLVAAGHLFERIQAGRQKTGR